MTPFVGMPSVGQPRSSRQRQPGRLLLLAAIGLAVWTLSPCWLLPTTQPRLVRTRLRAAVESAAEGGPLRIGHGWDIHRLDTRAVAGQPCVIGGVEIQDGDLGTVAHSDGDVLYHSVTDALLGAMGLPDIGQHFPDTDPRWKGAASDVFLAEAWRLMDERGYKIANLDATLVLERPKVGKFISAMEDNLAKALGVPNTFVNVKARTHERVDAIGERRALSCHAVILLAAK